MPVANYVYRLYDADGRLAYNGADVLMFEPAPTAPMASTEN